MVEVRAGGPYLGDGTERPDLVILTPVRPLDMVLVNELTALGIPHLLGSAFEGHGSAGPLVVPGQTACLHCLDLTRRDHDPAWPVVTAGLGGYPPGEIACDASLAASVAAAVAGHALNFLDGHASAVTNGTTDISPDRHWKHRSWTIHPQCRCIRTYPYPLTMVMSATCDSQAQVTTDEGGSGISAEIPHIRMSDLPRRAVTRSAKLATLPLSFAGRTALGLGKRIGGKSAEMVAEEIQQRTAEQIFKVLGELKGGAMKLGQALSIFEAALPPEIVAPPTAPRSPSSRTRRPRSRSPPSTRC
ncbi:hypothetical protein ACFSTC_05850 [Nonomuraea ferruginea]